MGNIVGSMSHCSTLVGVPGEDKGVFFMKFHNVFLFDI